MEMQKETRNTDLAAYLFHQGTNYRAQDYMGVHRTAGGYLFRLWAPAAVRVFVVGSFNRWEDTVPMTRTTEGGIWEAFVPAARASPPRRRRSIPNMTIIFGATRAG